MARGRGQIMIALVLAAAVGAIFWVPSMSAGRGWFPAPLDDVYIHFDYARSLGQGHPFEWIAGQGYSSGETSPLYAVLLAIGWVVGFRGRLLGVWAAILAVVCVATLLGSVRRLVRPCPAWLAWLLALLPLSIGIVDWSLFSGMEVAAFAAALGRALEALAATRGRAPKTREARQWRLGAWGIALVLLRPEAVVIVAVFAIIAARGAQRRSGFLALARAALPGALAVSAIAALNWCGTGDWRSAGAALKLLSSNPYMSDVDRARVYVENLITFWLKVVRGELAFTPALLFVLPLLALGGIFTRQRALVGACILSAFFWIALVSWNGNSPYHNFRYYAPALLLLAISAALTLASLPRRLAALVALATIGIAAPKWPGQVRFFRNASANIRDQHVEVGLRIAKFPDDTVVLVGDAGAIPYVSGKRALDALGLGGSGRYRYVDAAVQGEAAVIELIERENRYNRPTHLALYPNWFAGLSSHFGIEIDRVTIENNVITGGPTKVIYRADWRALEPRDETGLGRPSTDPIIEELDVADLYDEELHAYRCPQPHGGWTSLDVLTDASAAPRFDGGRTIPEGARESFLFQRDLAGPFTLRMRIDANARGITLVGRGELVLEPAVSGHWRNATIRLDAIAKGERLVFEARGSEYRDYHIWIERDKLAP